MMFGFNKDFSYSTNAKANPFADELKEKLKERQSATSSETIKNCPHFTKEPPKGEAGKTSIWQKISNIAKRFFSAIGNFLSNLCCPGTKTSKVDFQISEPGLNADEEPYFMDEGEGYTEKEVLKFFKKENKKLNAEKEDGERAELRYRRLENKKIIFSDLSHYIGNGFPYFEKN